MTPLFLVVGPPAVGKSTTSRALAGRFPKSVHIPIDDIRHMVVSGLVLPNAEWGHDLVQQFALARASAAYMAIAYQRAGFVVVIDDVWDHHCTADYQDLLTLPDVYRIVLYPDQDEAHERNLKRSGDGPGRAYIDEGIHIVYQQLRPVVSQLAQAGWEVVDTTMLTVEAVVIAVIQQTTGEI
jgi:hypothetical protein